MTETYSVYCDESCHLEHDGVPTMVMGAVWCSRPAVRELARIVARHAWDVSDGLRGLP